MATYTLQQKQQHLQKWQHSGLSQSQYCREHQLNLSNFHYWKSAYLPTNPPEQPTQLFVPVQMKKDPTPLTLIIDNHISLTCSLEQLADIVRVLRP